MSTSGFVLFLYSYDSTIGTFTVPPGGDGYYFFSTYLLGQRSEYSLFDIQINGDVLCTVRLEQHEISGDDLQSGCSAATYTVQGNTGWFHKGKVRIRRSFLTLI